MGRNTKKKATKEPKGNQSRKREEQSMTLVGEKENSQGKGSLKRALSKESGGVKKGKKRFN